MKIPKPYKIKQIHVLYKTFMIYISKQELMKSMFSWNKVNTLDVTDTGGSKLQNISAGVNQRISSLSGQPNVLKLPPIRFMHFTYIMSSSTEQTSLTYHSFLKITRTHYPTL